MTTATTEITTGDDVVLLQEITKYDKVLKKQVTFNIPDTATVKSRLISFDHETVYSEEIVQSDLTTGADWANSLIAVVFDSVATSDILNKTVLWKQGKIGAKVETQVNDGGNLTWFSTVIMVKGSIG
jgi:hypothetical protein